MRKKQVALEVNNNKEGGLIDAHEDLNSSFGNFSAKELRVKKKNKKGRK